MGYEVTPTVKSMWEAFTPGSLWYAHRTQGSTNPFIHIRYTDAINTCRVHWLAYPYYNGGKPRGWTKKPRAEKMLSSPPGEFRFVVGKKILHLRPATLEDILIVRNDAVFDDKVPACFLEEAIKRITNAQNG